MPISNDSINKKLYDLLKVQGFDPVPKNSKGDTTPVPNDADVFRFTFKVDGKPVGPAWITVDSNQDLKVYYDDETMGAINEDGGKDHIDDFTEFLQQLKMWSQRRQLGFDVENQDHLESDMAQREYIKQQEQINEGYYPMGKTSSYNDSVPSIKIILQHTRAIQEGEQRFRNISRIFLENTVGERILAPTTRPGIARIYARHLAEGGLPHDDRWNHVTSLVEEYSKMAGFVRATRGNQFNESAQQLVQEGINHYQSLRETLSRMTGHRGYNAYFESWTPALMEDETDNDTLNELFVQETVDPRIESVMPILSRIHKKVNEMAEVAELEEWADQLISEKMVLGSGSDASSAGSYKMGEATDLKNIPEEDLDDLEEDTMNTPAKSQVPAVQRKEKGGDWKVSKQDLEKEKERNISGPEGLKALTQRLSQLEEEQVEEGQFAGHYKTGPEGQWRNKGPKANKPAKVGDLVGANESFINTTTQAVTTEEGVAEEYSPAVLAKMNKINRDYYTKNPHMATDRENVSVAPGKLATRVTPTNPPTPVTKKSVDPTAKATPGFSKWMSQYKEDVAEGTYSKDVERAFPGGKASGVKTGASAPKGTSTMPKDKEKAKGKPAGSLNEMDKSQPSSDRGGESSGNPFAKGGKATPVKAKDIAKTAGKALNKAMDKAHKKDVKEGQEDLDAILRIIRK